MDKTGTQELAFPILSRCARSTLVAARPPIIRGSRKPAWASRARRGCTVGSPEVFLWLTYVEHEAEIANLRHLTTCSALRDKGTAGRMQSVSDR